ncbi:hypothetical protein Tco_1028451 [Tanacetum coccineum]|uniref:Uncharacterized protein n=1 Tax=Tanacetum coccineum TaxID=301880 RepID=A0ABQ5G213_9ASTR
MINQDIKDSNVYKTYYDFATGKVPPRKARKYKKVASPLRKLSPIKEAEPVKKAKRVKRPAKKSTTVPTAGVVLRDTPGVSVSKKKAPAKVDKSKGIEILYDVALSEVAQLKEATKRSKKDFHISQTSGSDEGTSTIPRVPNVPKYQSESNDESWGDSEDDNDDASKGDDDKANSDDDGNEAHDKYKSDDDNENVFEEEDDDDLYKDVDARSLGIEHEKERQGDEEMTDADQNEVSDFATPVIQSTITKSLKNVVLAKSSSQPQSTYEAAASFTKNLYDALIQSYQLNKDLFDSYGKAYSLKRSHEDKDKDEDPSVGPDQRLKKKKTSKDAEPSRGSKSKESNQASSKATSLTRNHLASLCKQRNQCLRLQILKLNKIREGPKRQKFYAYSSNMESKHGVFSKKRIIAVTHVKVMKWYGYGYLEEIIDLMLLLVQKKLSNLEQDVIFNLNIALRMFTRRIVILKRVEDLQLGVKSYQKKLNITKPETFRFGISKLTPYTAYKNP